MLNSTDSLFVNYSPDLFGTYKKAGLTGDTTYGNYLERALQGSATDSENNVVDSNNILGVVRYGPETNIAGKYLSFIGGSDKSVTTSPRSNYGTTDPVGFRVAEPPSAGDLMRGWALINNGTDQLL